MQVYFDGYRPGALGQFTTLQTQTYAALFGFELPFEARIAHEMAAFLSRYAPKHDLFRTVWGEQGQLLGGITVDGGDTQAGLAHLRWFILAPGARGLGLGRRLLAQAMDFANGSGAEGLFLTTVHGLDAARHLYQQAGFSCVWSERATGWGREMEEQRWEMRFTRATSAEQ